MRKIIGSRNQRIIKQLWPTVRLINAEEARLQQLSDADVQARTAEFRQRIAAGATPDDIMVEAFATVKNACRRMCGKSWDVCGH
ncbi:MAG: hypothetical protein NTV22_07755, partial [bacterium]|nr:hypothetical protein [bacterium]